MGKTGWSELVCPVLYCLVLSPTCHCNCTPVVFASVCPLDHQNMDLSEQGEGSPTEFISAGIVHVFPQEVIDAVDISHNCNVEMERIAPLCTAENISDSPRSESSCTTRLTEKLNKLTMAGPPTPIANISTEPLNPSAASGEAAVLHLPQPSGAKCKGKGGKGGKGTGFPRHLPYDILLKKAIKSNPKGTSRMDIICFIIKLEKNLKKAQATKGVGLALKRMERSGHIAHTTRGRYVMTPKGARLQFTPGKRFDRSVEGQMKLQAKTSNKSKKCKPKKKVKKNKCKPKKKVKKNKCKPKKKKVKKNKCKPKKKIKKNKCKPKKKVKKNKCKPKKKPKACGGKKSAGKSNVQTIKIDVNVAVRKK